MKTFRVDYTGDRSALKESLFQRGREAGVSMTGDADRGTFDGQGITGQYEYVSGGYEITISKKPFLYPWSVVEDAVRKVFST